MELGSTVNRYPLLNQKIRRKYTILIKFDMGIPMLARYNKWCCIDVDLMQFSSLGDEILFLKRRRSFDVGQIFLHRQTRVMPFWYDFDIAANVGLISTWFSSAIWETLFDIASSFDTNI